MKCHSLPKTIVVIVTDSITNSVFESQLLLPLQKRMLHDQIDHAVIVSFERSVINPELVRQIEARIPSTQLIIAQAVPFLGRWTLYPAIVYLKQILANLKNYQLLARGPLAGYIAYKAGDGKHPITIQARGLLAEEYDYTHQSSSTLLKKIVHTFRKNLFFNLEHSVYGAHHGHTIEAVSEALRDYLVSTYKAPYTNITIAKHDMPETLPYETKTILRTKIRDQLKIPHNAYVISYSGSLKPWQCFDQTVRYLETKIQQNTSTFFLVLTPDIQKAQQTINLSTIPSHQYHICSVQPTKLIEYLAAADAGILYREEHVVNWVSRPTKALEYQAAGLPIIHNNTVQTLINSSNSISI